MVKSTFGSAVSAPPRGGHSVRFTFFAATVAGAVLLALMPASMRATTPGQNGLIAFRRFLDPDQTRSVLFVIDPDGTDETQITFPGDNVVDALGNWSPDGSKLAFVRTSPCGEECAKDELYVVNADGSGLRQIATPEPTVESPAWSPDGQRIAFGLSTGGIVNDSVVDASIWEINVDGSDLRQVTHAVGFQQSEDHEVQFSPDGRRLVIVRQLASCGWCPGIFTVDASDGGNATRVSPRGLNGYDHPDWSPDGQWLIFRNDPGPGAPRRSTSPTPTEHAFRSSSMAPGPADASGPQRSRQTGTRW